MDKTAVLIPCYNEELTIAKVITDFHAALPDAVIYVYDNNSTDDTAKIASSFGKYVVLRHEYRQGKGNVIRSMFRDIEAECYVMVDGDDTYPAENAPEMVSLVLEGKADMVIGDRLSSTYFTENKRPFHNFGNRFVRAAINTTFKSKVRDIMTGYRAFSRPFVKNFPVLSKGFEIETEMTIHALDKNFLLREISVAYRDRPEGSFSKLSTVSDGLNVIKTIANLYRNYRPMSFFGLIFLVLIIAAAVFFVPVFVEYLNTGIVPRFPTLIMSGIIATIAFVMYICGVILDVITHKFKQEYELRLNRKD